MVIVKWNNIPFVIQQQLIEHAWQENRNIWNALDDWFLQNYSAKRADVGLIPQWIFDNRESYVEFFLKYS